jgi:hypothetical protein
MGAARIGALRVDLGLNSAAFEKGLDLAQRKLSSVGKQMQKAGEGLQNFGQSMSLAVTAPLVALGATSAQAAIESREALAQVEAALASMGDAAGRTLPQLQEQAAALQKLSTFDDDDILRKVTANMLTFGNVSGEAFDRAQQAAVDLSTRMGTDLQSSTLMIGKALNDPVKGIAALSRAGIQFSADQKAMIKSMVEAGNVAGAQAIMLGELEKQFGGAGKAARDAAPGSDQIDKWREVQERIGELVLVMGERLVPVVDKILDAFLTLSPEMQTAVVGFAAVAAAIGPVAFGVGAVVSAVGSILPLFGKLGFVLKALPALFTAAGVAVRFMLGPIGLIVTAVTAAYMVWKNWDKIEPILRRLYTAVKTWVVDKLNAVWDTVKAGIDRVKGYFYDMADAVVFNSYVPDMVDGIAHHMARLEAVMVKPAATATERASKAFEDMATRVGGILDRLFPESRAQLEFNADVSALQDALKRGEISADQFTEAMRRLRREHADAMLQLERNSPDTIQVQAASGDEIPQLFRDGFKDLSGAMDGVAKKADVTAVRVVESFRDMADKTVASFNQLANSIRSGGFLGILESVIGLGLQLGSIGAFGKKIQTNINRPIDGARALGGPVRTAASYLVGERGPEIFTPDRVGRIIPNSQLGGGGGGSAHITVGIDPRTGNLMAFVDGRIAGTAPAVASAGASQAMALNARASRRRVRG